jgi:hypothetical protein
MCEKFNILVLIFSTTFRITRTRISTQSRHPHSLNHENMRKTLFLIFSCFFNGSSAFIEYFTVCLYKSDSQFWIFLFLVKYSKKKKLLGSLKKQLKKYRDLSNPLHSFNTEISWNSVKKISSRTKFHKNPGQNFPDNSRIVPNECFLKVHVLKLILRPRNRLVKWTCFAYFSHSQLYMLLLNCS